jgi:hypothetical protein
MTDILNSIQHNGIGYNYSSEKLVGTGTVPHCCYNILYWVLAKEA